VTEPPWLRVKVHRAQSDTMVPWGDASALARARAQRWDISMMTMRPPRQGHRGRTSGSDAAPLSFVRTSAASNSRARATLSLRPALARKGWCPNGWKPFARPWSRQRRLFRLKGIERRADVVRSPYRSKPSRGRGRPPIVAVEEEDVVAGPGALLSPPTPIERHAFDYSDLELGMARLDLVVRRTRRSLDAVASASGRTTER
jgi:hypothetical protein